ncbi:MAG TPA: hypothetical protein VHT04_04280 [Stellaceae bacterium]|nr:hypothetical protein [Stellaceae bacterium]
MADQVVGFGARTGPMVDAVTMVSAKIQAIADATVAMFADAAEAPGRLAEAGRLLTGDGALGSPSTVLGAAAGAIAAALLVAMAVHHVLRPARLRLRGRVPETAERMAALVFEGLLLDAAPAAVYLAAGLTLDHMLFGPYGRVFVGTEVFRMVTSAVIINSAVAWFIAILLLLPIAAKRPNFRLLPIDDAQAERARNFVRRVVVTAAAS